MAESLKGKVAVITGVGSGFSKATAELFAKADRAPKQPLMDTGLTHNNGISWWVWAGSGTGLLLFVGGVILFWWRRVQAKIPTAGG